MPPCFMGGGELAGGGPSPVWNLHSNTLSLSRTHPTRRSQRIRNYDKHLSIFVYGTLKKGFCYHDRFCSRAIRIEALATWGRLYHLPAGFPALEVPDSSVLAIGTTDPLVDTQTQNTIEPPKMAQPQGDWDMVHGELLTFANPSLDLPPIDQLEEFNPDGRSMYQRVLVAAQSRDGIQAVWLYRQKSVLNGKRIAGWN
ncbi:MAG: gamma-glutamylcyclotransferase [Spirochaetota bacterium]